MIENIYLFFLSFLPRAPLVIRASAYNNNENNAAFPRVPEYLSCFEANRLVENHFKMRKHNSWPLFGVHVHFMECRSVLSTGVLYNCGRKVVAGLTRNTINSCALGLIFCNEEKTVVSPLRRRLGMVGLTECRGFYRPGQRFLTQPTSFVKMKT